MMLNNCIFHEPIIPCATLKRMCLLWEMSFNRSTKIFFLFKKIGTFLFWVVLYSLAVCKRTKGLYKMNNNSI